MTASDLTPKMVSLGHRRSQEAGVDVRWQEADAQALPWADASFDVALSCFGLVFAPDPDRACAEMARVVRPGGRIGLTAWRPGGL